MSSTPILMGKLEEMEDQEIVPIPSVGRLRSSVSSIFTTKAETLPQNQAVLSSPNSGMLQCAMLLAALLAYTLGGLLVNWSVVVHTPSSAIWSRVEVAARQDVVDAGQAGGWFGVHLAHRDGVLFVEKLQEGAEPHFGLAEAGGVLRGDVISRGTQRHRGVVFDSSDFMGLALRHRFAIERQSLCTRPLEPVAVIAP